MSGQKNALGFIETVGLAAAVAAADAACKAADVRLIGREISKGYGYVTGHLPPDGRRRRRTVWTLHHNRLHTDLRALIDATTPVSDPGTA